MRQMRRLLYPYSFFILFMPILILTGCSRTEEPVSKTGFFFDTLITITVYDTQDIKLLDSCFDLCRDYEQKFSRTITGSDTWNINHSNGKSVPISAETADLLALCQTISEQSGGAFDITIAPYIDLWDLKNNSGTIPDQTALDMARSSVSYENVQLNERNVTLKNADTQIDLGGIAKGYIADRLKDYLTEQGVTNAIINLGGNVLAIGSKPDHTPFQIGIQKPFSGSGEVITSLSLDNQTCVTSGTYERYIEIDGRIYHHILDPKNGYPCDNGLVSVSIRTDSSAKADALSTACFVLGLEKGLELIETMPDTEALFITEDLNLHPSKGWKIN